MKKHLLILSFLFCANLLAQKETSSYKYWITLGGFYFNDNISGNISYSFAPENVFYKVGWTVQDEFNLSSSGPDFNSIDISIGKRIKKEWWQIVFFAGPSYVFGKQIITEQNRTDFYTIGVQSDIQILFRVANEFGIGIGLWGNLNPKRSLAGLNINLALGNGK